MEYLFDLSVAEEHIYRLDKDDELIPELISCFKEIMTIAVNNYVNHSFCLPKEFSIKPISEKHEYALCSFINSCLVNASVIGIKYSNESVKINLA